MRSLFDRLYSLASSDRHQREDYLSEIVAAYLDSGQDVVERVLNHVVSGQFPSIQSYTVETQQSYPSLENLKDWDRPDLTLRIKTDEDKLYLVFIENKLSATESGDQLSNYARQLEAQTGDTDGTPILVYLTERADPKDPDEYEQFGIEFVQARWYEIHHVLAENELGSDWLREALISYIEGENLNMSRMFRPEDLYALRRSSAVFSLIDEALEGRVKRYLQERMNRDVRGRATRSTQVQKKDRYVSKTKIDREGYAILMGISWSERDHIKEHERPIATFVVQCAPTHEEREAILDKMGRISQRDNDFGETVRFSRKNWGYIHRYHPLVDVLPAEDHVRELEDWWLAGLQELVDAAEEGEVPYLARYLPEG